MTQQEKRIKLAIADGWKKDIKCVDLNELPCLGWRRPNDNSGTAYSDEYLPDYFKCLNAIHGLAASLSRQPDALRGYSDYTRYCVQLERLCGELPYDATAEQRAEAIGITLGLWENGE